MLHDELLEFERQIAELTERQESMCSQISEQVQRVVSEVSGGDLESEIFGSYATKLSMPWSDIDFIVCSKSSREVNPEQILTQIDQKFRELSKVFADVKFIPNTAVPLIKATCTPAFGGKKIDITVQDGKHSGPKCVELVHQYLESYQCLRFLVLPFKQLIYNSQMNDPYQGGLTSYALVLMLVAFLQNKTHRAETVDVGSPNLGKLFIEFLNCYSSSDYGLKEIRPFPPGVKVVSPPFFQSPDLGMGAINIVDPLNPSNNVAKSSYRFHFLKVLHHYLDRISFSLLSSRHLR